MAGTKGKTFLLPGARKHYAPNLMIVPTHIGTFSLLVFFGLFGLFSFFQILKYDVVAPLLRHCCATVVRLAVTTFFGLSPWISSQSFPFSAIAPAPPAPPPSFSQPDVRVDVDFTKRRCQCEIEKVFKGNAHPKTQRIELNAVGFLNLMVSSVSEHVVNHHYDGEVIQLVWEEPFLPHEERKVKFAYTVLNPVDGLFFSTPDEGYPARPTYVIADHETERARYWLPCVDFPAVRCHPLPPPFLCL